MNVVLITVATVLLAAPSTARTFTCENSTLLYSVKGQDDQQPFIVFQSANQTRVFYQDPATRLWDHEADPGVHGKSCDFRVITQPVHHNCLTTSDGGSDRDLNMCSGEVVDPFAEKTVAEHIVLVACSSDTSAFAKVANNEGSVHFLAAYHSKAQLEHSVEWDANNMTTTIENFMRKQTCDDDDPHSLTSGTATAFGCMTHLLVLMGAVTLSSIV